MAAGNGAILPAAFSGLPDPAEGKNRKIPVWQGCLTDVIP